MLGRKLLRGLSTTGLRLASTVSTQRFDGKVAVITGSTEGIGLAIAERLGQEGASIVVNSRKQENVDKAVASLKDQGVTATGITCNVSKAESRTGLLQHALKEFGQIDMLVANAAASPYFGPVFKTTESTWDKIFETNTKGTFFLVKEALPELEKTKGGIVVISTFLAFDPYAPLGVYSVSKTALLGLVKVMAPECAQVNVRVNGVAPGYVTTNFTDPLAGTETDRHFINGMAMKRPGRPEEIASVVGFLLSEDASYITGETIAAAAGYPTRL